MKYYKLSEVADKLGVARQTPYYWKKRGMFKSVVRFGMVLVTEAEYKKLRKKIRSK